MGDNDGYYDGVGLVQNACDVYVVLATFFYPWLV